MKELKKTLIIFFISTCILGCDPCGGDGFHDCIFEKGYEVEIRLDGRKGIVIEDYIYCNHCEYKIKFYNNGKYETERFNEFEIVGGFEKENTTKTTYENRFETTNDLYGKD